MCSDSHIHEIDARVLFNTFSLNLNDIPSLLSPLLGASKAYETYVTILSSTYI